MVPLLIAREGGRCYGFYMRILKIINNQDIFPDLNEDPQIKRWKREAARAIVVDDMGKIALLFVSRKNYHKLPGGGIEKGEDIPEALKREMIEEIGCDIEVTGEIGQIDEYRSKFELLQINYCFMTKVKGDKKPPAFVENEIKDGFRIMWVDIDDAVKLLENDATEDYAGKFIVMRDTIFLKEALNSHADKF